MKKTMTKAEREMLAKQIGEKITRSAYEASITTKGTKENSIAKKNLANAKASAQNLNQDLLSKINEIENENPLAFTLDEVKELRSQMVFIDIDDYEVAGTSDADTLKRSFGWERNSGKSIIYYDHKAFNSKMTEYRKAYRKNKSIYNAAAAKPRRDAELNLKALVKLLEANGHEYADKRYGYAVTSITEIEAVGDHQSAEYFKAELQKIMDKYGYSPKAAENCQDTQPEAQVAEQAEVEIAAIHRKVEENPDLETRAAVNHRVEPDNKLPVLTDKIKPVIEISKIDYVNNLANAVSNSNSKRRRWDVYTIKNAAKLKGFDDVRDAAQKVLEEGFDSFTVGDYISLTA